MQQYGGSAANNLTSILKTNEDADDEIETFRHSPYLSIDSLNDFLSSKTGEFSVLSLNSQSLQAKFDKLLVLLTHLKESMDFSFSAICVQETWLTDSHDLSLLQIPGYKLIHQGRRCCGHGGLIIYLEEKFSFAIKPLSINSAVWEGLFIDINHDNLKSKVTLGNIYRPPMCNNNNSTIDTFINEFRPVVDKLSKESPNLLLTGDFNLNLLSINDRTKIQEYFDLFVTNGLYPKITLPTRFSRKSASLIDQIFCKHNNDTQNSTSGIIHTYISDHLPYFTCVDIFRKTKLSPKFIHVYNNTPSAMTNFTTDVKQALTNEGFDTDLLADPNANYGKLEKIITSAKQKHLPSSLRKVNKYKHRLSPWITNGIIKSIKFRDKLYKEVKLTNPDSPEHYIKNTNLHTYNGILQKNIRAAKRIYYEKQFNKYKNDIKKTKKRKKALITEFYGLNYTVCNPWG